MSGIAPPPFSLRRNVAKDREKVWLQRNDVDVYTGRERRALATEQNVDHVLEVQIAEHATGSTLMNNRELTDRVRAVVNSAGNLNVTSRRINQTKRGPFTAAVNRLRKCDGSLRDISVEQLARSGRARWLVDEGIWANIETEVVKSYDYIENTLTNQRLTRAQTKLLDKAVDEIHTVLNKIQLF